METGTIPVAGLSGGFDLQSTLESGQTFLWRRDDGECYESDPAYGGSAWYHTVTEGEVVRVRQVDGRLEWESTTDADPILVERLRLDDDLAGIRGRAPDLDPVPRAFGAFEGMRIVRDPPFPCLISFICSAQMRVSRIHGMVSALSESFGDTVGVDGRTYHAFPTPDQLARASEDELRDLSLGYRAPYVQRTAEMVADGEAHPTEGREMGYEDARDFLTRFVGVGDKVADCACLFSLDHLEAVPLDTWINTAIEDHFPDCACDSYAETSRALREEFGGEHAGYVQTYVFHYLRTQ